MENYYQLLGVSEMATLLEIKAAYKRLAKAYHPDINPSVEAEEKFKLISTAYTVLSNQELRQTYDLRLAQARLNAKRASIRAQEQRQSAYKKPYQNYTYRPPIYRPSTDKNSERKATYYALAIVASVAILLYVGVSIFDFIQERKLQNKISLFDEQVKHADSLYYSGKVQAALSFIDKIKSSNHDFQAIKRHEIDYLTFRREQANIDYNNGAFQDALWGYLFFMEYSQSQNPDLQFRLAVCYRNLREPNKAIFILNELMNSSYKRMRMIALIGEIYKEELNDHEVAMQYYQIGLSSILAEFKSVYGNAYRLLVSAERTPESYKSIYYNAAEILYQQKEYTEASKLLEWVIFFQPKNEMAYNYLIHCYYELNNKKEACNIFNKAEKIDIHPQIKVELKCD
ncbi:DnaJ domain-containing protein [Marivirga harenae]|uniref:J domain-containing protein n=1 Tax=Marivirga harenae TaxID=2010992 RepID=UPI0026DECB4D|nr:DnaJ domain-containing protein [Marivirga harenae]WKV13619.1 DnaJ domain-containing protein [Marivirga harenae]|tara:strand:+ start:260300 stop:261496 length:1197 start_codon:yes stop_codon:yes gene_type:complete